MATIQLSKHHNLPEVIRGWESSKTMLHTLPSDINVPSPCFESKTISFFLRLSPKSVLVLSFPSTPLNIPLSQIVSFPVVALIISFVLVPFLLTSLRDNPFVKYYETVQFLKQQRAHQSGGREKERSVLKTCNFCT